MGIILVIGNWILFVIWNLLFVILSSHSLRRCVVAARDELSGLITLRSVYLPNNSIVDCASVK